MSAFRGAAAEGDAELMQRVQDDDAVAFGALYDRFSRRAFRIALAVARDRARAEDVVQEAFLSVWRARDRFRPEHGTLSAWVLSIVRYQAIDAAKADARHARRRSDESQLDFRTTEADGVEERAGERDEAARLRDRLTRLPSTQREAIALAYFGQMTTSEVADALGIPLGTVKGRLRLGLDKLRDAAPSPQR